MTSSRACVGILSPGDMGIGIARLLTANGYRVVTNVLDRSKTTQQRAAAARIDTLDTDADLCKQSDYILSIVPPRDALSIAERVVAGSHESGSAERSHPLYFLDLNAVSPRSARATAELVSKSASHVRFVDGGIIGGPPKQQDGGSWYRPSVVVSGPHNLADSQISGAHLAETLNMKHVNVNIGSASGLKMCFASLSKGLTALAIQSFTTAHQLGVVDELQAHLKQYSAKTGEVVNRGLPAMPPKAYRWVREMEEIADTFEEDGGFTAEESIFRGVAKTYALVADGTELGEEKTEARVRGKTAEDVATLMAEGVATRKEKLE